MRMEEPDFADLFALLQDDQKLDRYLVQLAMLPYAPKHRDEIVIGDFGFKTRDLPVLALCSDIQFNKKYPTCSGRITIKKKEGRRMVYRCGTCGANRANLSGYHLVRYMGKTTAFWAKIYPRKSIGLHGQASRSQILLILYCTAYGMSPLEVKLVLGRRYETSLETVKRWQLFVRKLMVANLQSAPDHRVKMEMKSDSQYMTTGNQEQYNSAHDMMINNSMGIASSVTINHGLSEQDSDYVEVEDIGEYAITPSTSRDTTNHSILSETTMCNNILEYEREEEISAMVDNGMNQEYHRNDDAQLGVVNGLNNESTHSDVESDCGSDLPVNFVVKPSNGRHHGISNMRRRKDAFLNLVRLINKEYTCELT